MTESLADWHDLATIAGGASAALTGLLFVAVSFNADRINQRPVLRAAAAQTLVLLVAPLPTSIVLAVPDLPRWATGAALLLIAAVCGVALTLVGKRKSAEALSAEQRLGRVLDRISPNLLTCVLLGLSGLSVLVNVGGGLLWLVPALILALLGGIVNAWLLLTRLTGD